MTEYDYTDPDRMTPLPEWLAAPFTVKAVDGGYLLMDGDTPVSRAPFSTLKAANSCMRECQARRETQVIRWLDAAGRRWSAPNV